MHIRRYTNTLRNIRVTIINKNKEKVTLKTRVLNQFFSPFNNHTFQPFNPTRKKIRTIISLTLLPPPYNPILEIKNVHLIMQVK